MGGSCCVPLGGVTAYPALFFTVGRLHAAQTILVIAAGSRISTLAVCLAAQAGARVLVTSSSEEKLSRAGELGADAGVLSTEANWADEILRLTGGRGVDVVLDSVGSTWAIRSAACAKGGRLVVIGGTGGPKVELDVRRVYLSWLSILGTTMGSRADFAALLQMVNEGRWSPVIDSVRPLSEASRRMSE